MYKSLQHTNNPAMSHIFVYVCVLRNGAPLLVATVVEQTVRLAMMIMMVMMTVTWKKSVHFYGSTGSFSRVIFHVERTVFISQFSHLKKKLFPPTQPKSSSTDTIKRTQKSSINFFYSLIFMVPLRLVIKYINRTQIVVSLYFYLSEEK